MLEAHLRSHIQPLLNLLARGLITLRCSADGVTLLSFIFGVGAGAALAGQYVLVALILMWLSGLGDALDGTIARLTGTSHNAGAYIDLISDRMVEAAIIIGFALFAPQHYLSYILFLVFVLLHFSTFVVAGALFKNSGPKSMYYDKSIVERGEAFVTFSLMMIFPQFLVYFLAVFNLLVLCSAATRFFRVLAYARRLDN